MMTNADNDKKADVVIGAAYGDEGKGLMTDYLAHHHGANSLVVRFNGGAQAGHSVETPEGIRHVFSHFGAGSFNQSASFLSRFFVINPLLFVKEWAVLKPKLSFTPKLYADARAIVTTPYDMMINQLAEEARGHNRHGSCGMGFGETIERNTHPAFAITVHDLNDFSSLQTKLNHIKTEWVPLRLQQLGITAISDEWRDRLASTAIIDKFLNDTAEMLTLTEIAPDDFLKKTTRPIVFEGAQGLLLDQDKGRFPHVTRSNTGLKNVLTLADEAAITTLKVHYMTRAYTTRHGAGPLAYELPHKPYPKIHDATNITNPFQGHLRFAYLDCDLLSNSILDDLKDAQAYPHLTIQHGLVMTCCDQLEEGMHYYHQNTLCQGQAADVLHLLEKKVNFIFLYTAHAPNRTGIKAFKS